MGRTQRALLEALEASEYLWCTVAELAEALQRSPRQVLAAVRSLEGRGLVVITRETIGWNEGVGRLAAGYRGDCPAVLTVEEGEPWPNKPGYVARRRTEFYRVGTPVHGLAVWLPERREQHAERTKQAEANLRAAAGQ